MTGINFNFFLPPCYSVVFSRFLSLYEGASSLSLLKWDNAALLKISVNISFNLAVAAVDAEFAFNIARR